MKTGIAVEMNEKYSLAGRTLKEPIMTLEVLDTKLVRANKSSSKSMQENFAEKDEKINLE